MQQKNPKKSMKNQNVQKLSKMVKNSEISKNIKKKNYISKNLKIKKKKFGFAEENKKFKNCHLLSFPILGGCYSTRALQSSPFQNPVGGPLSLTESEQTNKQRKSLCLI